MSRKNWLILKLVILVCILIIVSAISIGVIINKYVGRNQMENTVGVSREFSQIEKVKISTYSIPVQIVESDVKEVTVIDNSKKVKLGLSYPNTLEQQGDTLIFKEGKTIGPFNFTNGELIVKIPKNTPLEYNIDNVSSEIFIDAPIKNDFTCNNVSGSIKIYSNGEDADISSISGSIRVYGAFRQLNVSSTSGSVRITADKKSEEINVSNISGSLRIRLKDIEGYNLKLNSVSGSFEDSYRDISGSRQKNYYYGDESLKINVDTVSGSCKLSEWD